MCWFNVLLSAIQVFYGILLQYFAVLANKKPLNIELLNMLVKPLIDMSGEIPYFAAICARQRLLKTRAQFCEALKNPGFVMLPWTKPVHAFFFYLFLPLTSWEIFLQRMDAGLPWKHCFSWGFGPWFFRALTIAMLWWHPRYCWCVNISCAAPSPLVVILPLVPSCAPLFSW